METKLISAVIGYFIYQSSYKSLKSKISWRIWDIIMLIVIMPFLFWGIYDFVENNTRLDEFNIFMTFGIGFSAGHSLLRNKMKKANA